MFNSIKYKYTDKKRRNKSKRKLYFEGRPTYSSDDSLSDDEELHEPNNNKEYINKVCKGKKS